MLALVWICLVWHRDDGKAPAPDSVAKPHADAIHGADHGATAAFNNAPHDAIQAIRPGIGCRESWPPLTTVTAATTIHSAAAHSRM